MKQALYTLVLLGSVGTIGLVATNPKLVQQGASLLGMNQAENTQTESSEEEHLAKFLAQYPFSKTPPNAEDPTSGIVPTSKPPEERPAPSIQQAAPPVAAAAPIAAVAPPVFPPPPNPAPAPKPSVPEDDPIAAALAVAVPVSKTPTKPIETAFDPIPSIAQQPEPTQPIEKPKPVEQPVAQTIAPVVVPVVVKTPASQDPLIDPNAGFASSKPAATPPQPEPADAGFARSSQPGPTPSNGYQAPNHVLPNPNTTDPWNGGTPKPQDHYAPNVVPVGGGLFAYQNSPEPRREPIREPQPSPAMPNPAQANQAIPPFEQTLQQFPPIVQQPQQPANPFPPVVQQSPPQPQNNPFPPVVQQPPSQPQNNPITSAAPLAPPRFEPLPPKPALNAGMPVPTPKPVPAAPRMESQFLVSPSVMVEQIPCHGTEMVARVGTQVLLMCDILPQLRRHANMIIAENLKNVPEEKRSEIPEDEKNAFMEQVITANYPPLLQEQIMLTLVYNDFIAAKKKEEIEFFEKRMGEEFDQNEVPRMMKEFKVKNIAELKAYLKDDLGSSLEREKMLNIRAKIAQQWIMFSVKEAEGECTHDEMMDFYTKNHILYEKKGRVRWKELFVLIGKDGEKAAWDKIQWMGNQIVVSKAPFDKIAEANSDGFTAKNGGIWDWTGEGSFSNAEIEKLLFTLPPNEMSSIIKGPKGLHIVMVVERENANVLPFKDAQPDIRARIKLQRRQKYQDEYVTELKRKYPVKVLRETIDFKPAVRAVAENGSNLFGGKQGLSTR